MPSPAADGARGRTCSSDLTRREFLIAGGVGVAVGSRVIAASDVIYAGADRGGSAPIERTVMTLCRHCPGGCGLRARVSQDRVVGLAGNPLHPANRGGLCPRAPAAVQSLYNPDRLMAPRVLAGPKGSGQFRAIGWTEAIDRLAERLRSVRQRPGPHAAAVVINGDRGLTRLLWIRFLQAYGSNNLIDWSSPEGHGVVPAVWAMQGFDRAIAYDLSRTKFVLSFGSQWLDAHWSPAQASEAFAEMRSGDPAFRPRFVNIEPRLSVTGTKADEWVPIRPGTEGALAMGLAHVLLREGLYDRAFVEHLTHGFEDPEDGGANRIGYRQLVLRDYAPSRVSAITGVDEAAIFRLAREFAIHRPALAIGFDGSGVAAQRTYDRMAIHALNALVGSIDVPGGVTHFQDLDVLALPVPELDAAAEAGLAKPRIDRMDTSAYPLGDIPVRKLAEHILAELPYPIEVLILAGANPVFDSPHPDRMKEALAKVPFVVSLSPWIDDTARWADMIIPEAHFLARWEVDVSHTFTGRPTVTFGQPVVAPPPDAVSGADLVLRLAAQVSEPTAEALPFSNSESVVGAISDTLARSGRGGPFGPQEEVDWTQLMERSGWRSGHAVSAAEFRQSVIGTGGWSDPIYYPREWDRVFRSPQRRFAFHSTLIAQRTRPRTGQDDLRCLPHYEPIPDAEPDETYPLRLYVYPLPLLAGMTDASVPWLIDRAGAVMGQRWRGWAEINPATAEHLHIAEGDRVVVTSPRGRLETYARLFEGIMPEVVAIPWGLGHEGGGRWSDGVGQNPSALVDARIDPLTAGPIWSATKVSVQRA
jgi:anaerobic selenocysteine-containing dehydrogenase